MLPREFGRVPFLATPSAGLRYLLRPIRSIDPSLLKLVSEFVAPRAVVWDVGANVGFFSFAAAHRAGIEGRVIAVEPDIWLAQLLRRSASFQPSTSAPVTVVPCAIGLSVGLRTFCLAARSRSANYLAEYNDLYSQAGGVLERQTVVTLSLDALSTQLAPPDVLKLDAEGAELEILQGGRKLIETTRPVVLCEVGSAAAPTVTSLLVALGYELFDGEAPDEARIPVSAAPWSTVAIPLGREPRHILAGRS